MKICRRCMTGKDESEFSPTRRICKKCKTADFTAWRRKQGRDNPLGDRAYNYGLKGPDILAMYFTQNGRCYICTEPESPENSLHVDHHHSSGRIRALLCRKCNHAVGNVCESPTRAREIATYLEHFSAV